MHRLPVQNFSRGLGQNQEPMTGFAFGARANKALDKLGTYIGKVAEVPSEARGSLEKLVPDAELIQNWADQAEFMGEEPVSPDWVEGLEGFEGELAKFVAIVDARTKPGLPLGLIVSIGVAGLAISELTGLTNIFGLRKG